MPLGEPDEDVERVAIDPGFKHPQQRGRSRPQLAADARTVAFGKTTGVVTERHRRHGSGCAISAPICADFGSMPITTLAIQIWALCASTSLADGDRWLHPGPCRPSARSVEVVPEGLGSGRVAQLRHGLGLDLADPLPGHPVDLPDLIE